MLQVKGTSLIDNRLTSTLVRCGFTRLLKAGVTHPWLLWLSYTMSCTVWHGGNPRTAGQPNCQLP